MVTLLKSNNFKDYICFRKTFGNDTTITKIYRFFFFFSKIISLCKDSGHARQKLRYHCRQETKYGVAMHSITITNDKPRSSINWTI